LVITVFIWDVMAMVNVEIWPVVVVEEQAECKR
jgi:hypothetical protein